MTEITMPGTDADLHAALNDLNLPTLLMVITQLSGDDEWLSERYRPQPIVTPEGSLFPDDSGGYSDEIAEEIREAGFKLLKTLRDQGGTLPPAPDLAQMRRMMEFSTAEPVEDAFCAMLLEETGFVDRDRAWLDALERTQQGKPIESFSVIIVGAGMSGICAAAKLKAAGIPYVVLEKNAAVGGTWYENRYPDCGVDTPNHFYSFSFERNPNWSGYFSKRDELYDYFEACTDKFGIRDHIRFETEVTDMRFDAAEELWQVTACGTDGRTETLTANVVISAVGQLNRPSVPELPGLDRFAGTSFHSARWRSDVDLEGKRVAVIGTGCTAVQLLPKTAERAAHTTVFQRSPHWISPNKDYYRPVEAGLQWALNHIPLYAEWHRARMIFGFMDRNWPAVPADPAWEDGDRAMSELNDGLREALTGYIREQLGERQDLMEKCVPKFPVFGKRLIIDNNWYPTVARDDVELVTDAITAVHPHGIETADGSLHEVDVIIFATGFNTNHFLWPMDVVGKSGETLEARWGDYPRAYKGMLVPDYPNLFCLYGPNTNIVHGGSIIYSIECQVHYLMQCLALMLERRASTLEIPEAVNNAYNDEVQAISRNLAWGHPGVQSWYKNSDGKVVNNSPFSNLEFWERTHDVEPNRYALQ
ncbi:MAG: NAD(P)/FAD-dependent oxidoreductase [Pseudomonadota bacterium]